MCNIAQTQRVDSVNPLAVSLMEARVEKSLHHHNRENFRRHLAATEDDVQRRMSSTLLAEEEAKERPVLTTSFGLGALAAGDRGLCSVARARFGSAMFETSLQGSRHRQPELRIDLLPVTLVVEAVVGLTCTT